MKTIALIAGLLFTAATGPIQVNGLKPQYKQNEKMNYSVANNTKMQLFVNIALEANVNNRWKEVVGDITTKTVRSVMVYPVKAGTSKSFSYDLARLDKALFKNKTTQIRIKIYFGNKMNNTTDIFRSSPVTVVQMP